MQLKQQISRTDLTAFEGWQSEYIEISVDYEPGSDGYIDHLKIEVISDNGRKTIDITKILSQNCPKIIADILDDPKWDNMWVDDAFKTIDI